MGHALCYMLKSLEFVKIYVVLMSPSHSSAEHPDGRVANKYHRTKGISAPGLPRYGERWAGLSILGQL